MHVLCTFLRRMSVLYVIGYRGHPIKKGKLQATEIERERERVACDDVVCLLATTAKCSFLWLRSCLKYFLFSPYIIFFPYFARALGQKASAKATAVKSAEIHWNDNKTKSCCCCCCCFVFSYFFFVFIFLMYDFYFLLYPCPAQF